MCFGCSDALSIVREKTNQYSIWFEVRSHCCASYFWLCEVNNWEIDRQVLCDDVKCYCYVFSYS